MPLRGIINPEELAVLSQALEEHCAENAIDPNDPDREHIAYRLIALFGKGVTTVDELKRNLKD